MAERMVKADLRVNMRAADGKLYRAGRDREIPAALAEEWGLTGKAAKAAEPEGDADTGAGAGDAETVSTAPAKSAKKTAKGKGK